MKTTNISGICLLLIVSFIAVTLKAQERQQHGNGTSGTETYLEQQMRLEREKALKTPPSSGTKENSSGNDKKPLFVSDYDKQRRIDRYNELSEANKKFMICKKEWINGDRTMAWIHLDECKSSLDFIDHSLAMFIEGDCFFNSYLDGIGDDDKNARRAVFMAVSAAKSDHWLTPAANFESEMLSLLSLSPRPLTGPFSKPEKWFKESINGSMDYYAIQGLIQLSQYCVHQNELKKALKYCNQAYDRNHSQEYAYFILTQRARINELLNDEKAMRNDLDEIAKIYSDAKDIYTPTCACSSMNSLLLRSIRQTIGSYPPGYDLIKTKCEEIKEGTLKHEAELKGQIFHIAPDGGLRE